MKNNPVHLITEEDLKQISILENVNTNKKDKKDERRKKATGNKSLISKMQRWVVCKYVFSVQRGFIKYFYSCISAAPTTPHPHLKTNLKWKQYWAVAVPACAVPPRRSVGTESVALHTSDTHSGLCMEEKPAQVASAVWPWQGLKTYMGKNDAGKIEFYFFCMNFVLRLFEGFI